MLFYTRVISERFEVVQSAILIPGYLLYFTLVFNHDVHNALVRIHSRAMRSRVIEDLANLDYHERAI